MIRRQSMTLSQLEAMGDEFLNEINNENLKIAEDLFGKIKSLPDEEKKYLKLYLNTKISMERSGYIGIFSDIRKALDSIFKELREIKVKAFGK